MAPIPAFSCSGSIGLIITFVMTSITPETGVLLPNCREPEQKRLSACREIRHGRRANPDALMRIATWNVNSIKQRIENLTAWLRERQPDIVCLQETKSQDETFPREPFEALGYNVAVHGQKTFNGVAILSRLPLDEVTPRLPGDPEDDHARFIEAVVSTKTGALRVASIYLPNGNPIGPKYDYKIKWMKRLSDYSRELDVHNPELWRGDALFLPETRAKFRALINLGLTDALRANTNAAGIYTFWDYQAGAWQKNNGIRIDHLLLSPQAADRLVTAGVDKHVRAWEKPSDHVPVWIELDLEAA
jgi:exodeoxyribonuclease-3